MEEIELSILGRQHFAMPGSPMMEQQMKEECEETLADLKEELSGEAGPVEIVLVGEEAAGEESEADEKQRLIGELVGRLMETAHELSPETELCTCGTLEEDGEGLCLSYDESALTGMEGSVTVLRIGHDGTVSLNRGGRVATNLVFEKGKRCQCLFDGYGPKGMPVSVYTRQLKIRRWAAGGSVKIDYFIEVGGTKSEHSEFLIRWSRHKSASDCIE